MPKYLYFDPDNIDDVIEVTHTMKECREPSPETLDKIALPGGMLRLRKFTAPQLMGFDSLGRSLSGAEKKAHIKKDRRKRSHEHFKKEVFPTLPQSDKVHHAIDMGKKGEDISKLEF